MSRRKRTSHKRDDSIGDLQAWQDHQYDPGYLPNMGRLRLFSGRGRRNRASHVLRGLGALFALMLIFIGLVQVGIPYAIASILFVIALLAVLVVTLARLGDTHEQAPRRGRGKDG